MQDYLNRKSFPVVSCDKNTNMTISQKNIRKLLAIGETEKVEFKSSFGKAVIEPLYAFANHEGGEVIIGVDNTGKVTGITPGPETIQGWINQIKQKTLPAIIPDANLISLNNKQVTVLTVNEFPVKPVAFRDRYYKRVANSNHRLSVTEIANLHLQSLQLSWDSYTDTNADLVDLNTGKIQNFLARVKKEARFRIEEDWQTVFRKLGYLQGNNPTHAAMLLFGKKAPQYSIHIGRFKSGSTIIDDRMIHGTLFDVVTESMRFILSHLKIAFEITDTIQRQEIYEYPLPALRELLLNAVVHRDYTSPVDTHIKIFDNKITFLNPGKLFGDLTIANLDEDDYQSRTRNKLIAEAFYLCKEIEKYGSGFIRIRAELLAYPTMELAYEENGDGFLVALHYRLQKISSEMQSAGGISEGIKLLLQHIRKLPGQRTPQLASSLNVPAKTIERWIRELKKQSLIEFRGSKKSGGYYGRKTR
jgi:ATP-dependent DNA helicase RecG